jgi:hypothetical protein
MPIDEARDERTMKASADVRADLVRKGLRPARLGVKGSWMRPSQRQSRRPSDLALAGRRRVRPSGRH